MKIKIRVLLGLLACIVILAGCGKKPDEQVGQLTTEVPPGSESELFEGYVVKKEDSRILVVNSEVHDFSANGGASNNYNAIWFSNSPFNIEVGQLVGVHTDGDIMESYPAQGVADTVAVYEVEKPKGAQLAEAEVIVKALSISDVAEYEVPVIKEVKYDAITAQWVVHVTQNGDSNVREVIVVDQVSAPVKEFGPNPPMPVIEAGGKAITVYQSSYCWSTGCADYVGPEGILKDKPKDQVSANTPISFVFDVKHPTTINVQRFQDGIATEVNVTGDTFQTPEEPGVYYYNLSAFWMKAGSKNISEGDSSYVFVLEVVK